MLFWFSWSYSFCNCETWVTNESCLWFPSLTEGDGTSGWQGSLISLSTVSVHGKAQKEGSHTIRTVQGFQGLFLKRKLNISPKLDLLILFYMWLLCLDVCICGMCVVGAMEVRRGHPIPWKWSYECLWTPVWALGIEAGFLQEQQVLLILLSHVSSPIRTIFKNSLLNVSCVQEQLASTVLFFLLRTEQEVACQYASRYR